MFSAKQTASRNVRGAVRCLLISEALNIFDIDLTVSEEGTSAVAMKSETIMTIVETAKVLTFIQSLDIKAIATEVMYKLFAMLEMKYDFKLSRDGEMEVTT